MTAFHYIWAPSDDTDFRLAKCYVVAKGIWYRKQMPRTHVVCMRVYACVCVSVCVCVCVCA